METLIQLSMKGRTVTAIDWTYKKYTTNNYTEEFVGPFPIDLILSTNFLD